VRRAFTVSELVGFFNRIQAALDLGPLLQQVRVTEVGSRGNLVRAQSVEQLQGLGEELSGRHVIAGLMTQVRRTLNACPCSQALRIRCSHSLIASSFLIHNARGMSSSGLHATP
jgi:hypothetical protein